MSKYQRVEKIYLIFQTFTYILYDIIYLKTYKSSFRSLINVYFVLD